MLNFHLSYAGQMVKFIQSISGVAQSMLSHMETSAIMDLLLKLISMDEYTEGAGVVDVSFMRKQDKCLDLLDLIYFILRHCVHYSLPLQWLDSEGLIELLISKLDPNLDSEVLILYYNIVPSSRM